MVLVFLTVGHTNEDVSQQVSLSITIQPEPTISFTAALFSGTQRITPYDHGDPAFLPRPP